MPTQVQNPPFLNAQKIKIHSIDNSSQSEVKVKNKLSSSPSKRKYVRPIVSFLNFCKDKNMQITKTEQNENANTFSAHKKEENFQFHEFQQHQNSISQVGSQYGQKNYDHQLKQVLKKQKRSSRKELNTPKVMLRAQTQQKQNFESITKYQRFQKFRTQIQNKNDNIKEELVDYELYDIEGDGMKKMSRFCPQVDKNQLRVKTQANSKHDFLEKRQWQAKEQDQVKKTPQYEYSTFKPLQIDPHTTFEPIEFKKGNSFTPSHRRSRTQDEVLSHDKEKADQIFQKYHKLKKNYIKSSKSKQLFFNDRFKPATPTNIQLCQKSVIPQQTTYKKRFSNDGKKLYRSLPKYEPMAISQSISNFNSPTSRVIMTPKSLSRANIDEQLLNNMVKQRQKEFFDKNHHKPFEMGNFTFEQIKSKLSKIELNEAKKTKKSSAILSNKKNVLLYSDYFKGGTQEKSKLQEKQGKQEVLKFKGISFKANLIRKHTDVYEKQMKKMIQKNMSLKVTPKQSHAVV